MLEDLNTSIQENKVKCVHDTYDLKNLIMQPMCYKHSENPTCVDLMLKTYHTVFTAFVWWKELRKNVKCWEKVVN